MNSGETILKELKDREQSLLYQLQKIRSMIEAFSGKVQFEDSTLEVVDFKIETYNVYSTYDEKIFWALKALRRPLYVREIVDKLIKEGEPLEISALIKRITYNASKLHRQGLLTADKQQKKYKYSLG